MGGFRKYCVVCIWWTVVASAIALTTVFADEEKWANEYQGWVKTYCDGRPAEDEVYLEAGTCSLDPGYYQEAAAGVRYKILRRGSGRVAERGDVVVVEYLGWLFNEGAVLGRGVMFDTSYTIDRNSFVFPLGARRVIQGWEKGIEGMQPGEIRELIIAPEMGYGDSGAGGIIPPKSTLLFEVELLSFTNNE